MMPSLRCLGQKSKAESKKTGLHSPASGSASAPHLGLPLPPALWSIFFIVLIIKVIKEVVGLKDALSGGAEVKQTPKVPS